MLRQTTRKRSIRELQGHWSPPLTEPKEPSHYVHPRLPLLPLPVQRRRRNLVRVQPFSFAYSTHHHRHPNRRVRKIASQLIRPGRLGGGRSRRKTPSHHPCVPSAARRTRKTPARLPKHNFPSFPFRTEPSSKVGSCRQGDKQGGRRKTENGNLNNNKN